MPTHRITGPADALIPSFGINGVMFPVVADLPEGGFLQIIPGENPLAQPVPGVQIPKGAMLAIVIPEVANHIRGNLKAVEREIAKMPFGPPAGGGIIS